MPTYLCHGFQWHRPNIRIFVALHNLEDAAPDWIIGPTTSDIILRTMYDNYDFIPRLPESKATAPSEPKAEPSTKLLHHDDDFTVPPSKVPISADSVLRNEWSAVKLLEEHDVLEQQEPTRPYAFAADYVIRIDLHAEIGEEMARYEKAVRERGNEWFEKLRDEVQRGEPAPIQWYVVVCGDEERPAPSFEGSRDGTEVDDQETGARLPNPNQVNDQDNEDQPQTGENGDNPAPAGQLPLRHKGSIRNGFRRMFRQK